ncbi:DNA polymerase-4 [Natranaerovirga hydrolytica]|uniref:DNA polymerase IV n=1 Tax=Natranaerovirga hydrolytica TaxID=680378 RepID=A0A4R1M3S7_9FIRM|nr:DNA polymerase IV [Natranaerovirga hydrolytica]TCK86756.1 DNA polymerase-4 [Natranaerovirga hydrolytica]
MHSKVIFHIDVNSAYLSWEATSRLQNGHSLDLRTIPSAIGGDVDKRRGIILAKSIPAKKYNIKTGESLMEAFKKCPDLKVVPPNYDLYMQCSNAMVHILKDYSPFIQRYSVDECFLDYSNMDEHFGSPVQAATTIQTRIYNALGFTVNIGISSNKLLAKMASDFQKPNLVHTLFPEEIEKKMWPLPIGDLFMVGKSSAKKLLNLGIYTIGDLAKSNPDLLYTHLKSHGLLIWNYANGMDHSLVSKESDPVKGIGNSTTIPFDVEDEKTAKLILLSLCESVCMRLRQSNLSSELVHIKIKTNNFHSYSHQKKLLYGSNITHTIYQEVCLLFDEVWDKEPIRQLGVRVSNLNASTKEQLNLFDTTHKEKLQRLDDSIDSIRKKYGNEAILRGCFINAPIKPFVGGMPTKDYPIMSSLL